jgi:transcriptional regulator GlxA family with amidase domain
MDRKTVGILIFDDVEVLDFCGPFEVFSITRLDEDERLNEPSPFQVLIIAEQDRAVVAAGGLRVLPDYTLETCPALDVLLVPGGKGTRREVNNENLIAWIAKRGGQVEILSSVCTGALLLGKAGLLDGHRATTHWASLGLMRSSFPRIAVEEDVRVVVDSRVMTSAGVAAGIDLALTMVTRYFGGKISGATARRMEYPFQADDGQIA